MRFFNHKESLGQALTRLLRCVVQIENGLYQRAHGEWYYYREIDGVKGRQLFLGHNDARESMELIGNKIRELTVLTAYAPSKEETKRAWAVVDYLDTHPVFQKLLERYLKRMITKHLATLTGDYGTKYNLVHLIGEATAYCLDRESEGVRERINLSSVFSRSESMIWLGTPQNIIVKPQLSEDFDEKAVIVTVESMGDEIDIVISKSLFDQDNACELPTLADYIRFSLMVN